MYKNIFLILSKTLDLILTDIFTTLTIKNKYTSFIISILFLVFIVYMTRNTSVSVFSDDISNETIGLWCIIVSSIFTSHEVK